MKYSINIFLTGLLVFSNLIPISVTGSTGYFQFDDTLKQDTTRIKVYIDGMSCERCVQKIEKKVSAVEGVRTVNVFLQEKYAIIVFDNKISTIKEIISKIEASGYVVNRHEVILNKKG